MSKNKLKFQRLMIEPTSKCSMACTWCPHPSMDREKITSDITFMNDLVKNANENLDIDRLAIVGIGEPFLSPNTPELINYSKSIGLPVAIQTNGAHPKKAKEFLKKIKWLGLSLQTITRDAYKTKSFSKKFELYMKDVFSIIDESQRQKKKIVLSILLKRKTLLTDFFFLRKKYISIYNQILFIYPFLKILSIKYGKPKQSFFNIFTDYKLNFGDFLEINIDDMTDWMKEISIYQENSGITFIPSTMGSCRIFNAGPMILADRRVAICCVDATGKTSIGKLIDSDINSFLINSKKYTKIKESFDKNEVYDSTCQKCLSKLKFKNPIADLFSKFDYYLINKLLRIKLVVRIFKVITNILFINKYKNIIYF